MDKSDKRITIAILLIVFGIVFVSSNSDFLETFGMFLLIIGGTYFGNAITLKNN
jgi:hypothetical protein